MRMYDVLHHKGDLSSNEDHSSSQRQHIFVRDCFFWRDTALKGVWLSAIIFAVSWGCPIAPYTAPCRFLDHLRFREVPH